MKKPLKLIENPRPLEQMSEGLWFNLLGGAGTIRCLDCKHSEEITSFIHGVGSISGFQCPSCGKLSSVKSGRLKRANNADKKLVCACGGTLERDKVIFCPSCRSKELFYEMTFIS